MPLDAAYFEKVRQARQAAPAASPQVTATPTAPAPTAPSAPSPQTQTDTLLGRTAGAAGAAVTDTGAIIRDKGKSFIELTPRDVGAAFFGGNRYNRVAEESEWEQMSRWQRGANMLNAAFEGIVRFPGEVAKETAKGFVRAGASAARLRETVLDKTGLADTGAYVMEPKVPDKFELPLLGEIKTYDKTFKDIRESNFSENPWVNNAVAGLGTGAQAFFDISIVDGAVIDLFRPGLKGAGRMAAKNAAEKGFAPLPPAQLNEVRTGILKATQQITKNEVTAQEAIERISQIQGRKLTRPEQVDLVKSLKANGLIHGKVPTAAERSAMSASTRVDLSPEVAAALSQESKKSVKNLSIVGIPRDGEAARYFLVDSNPKFGKMSMDKLKKKYGPNNVIATENGPVVVLNKVSTERGAVAKQSVKPAAESGALASQNADVAAKEAVETVGDTVTPGVMQRPLKGFTDKPVTNGQLNQIRFVQKEKGFTDDAAAAISRVITGKDDIAALSQDEAFRVSEVMRAAAKGAVEEIGENPWISVKSYATQPTRVWMNEVYTSTGKELPQQVYYPLTMGMQMAKSEMRATQNTLREGLGRFATVSSVEERRLLSSYVQGAKDAVLKNEALTPAVRAELAKTGDFLIEYFADSAKRRGIDESRFYKEYLPRITDRDTFYKIYKTDELPGGIKPFFEFERRGGLDPIVDDVLAAADIYARMDAMDKYVRPALDNAIEFTERELASLPKTYKATNDWLHEIVGHRGIDEELMDNIGKTISKKSNGRIPTDVMDQAMSLAMTNSYAGVLGLPRAEPIFQNLTQFMMIYAEGGPKGLARAVRWAADKGNRALVRDEGFLLTHGVAYGEEFAKKAGQGSVGKAVEAYKGVGQMALAPQAASDSLGRYLAHGLTSNFDEAWSAFQSGAMSYDAFLKEIDMRSFSEGLQDVLQQKFSKNTKESIKEAKQLMARDVIDRTMFPYRKGEASRAFYGAKGKIGLQFGTFSFEYFNTLYRNYLGRGQYDKLIRLFTVGEIMNRSMESYAGIDTRKYTGANPVGFSVGPLASLATNIGGMFSAMKAEQDDMVDQYKKDIVRQIKIFGGPAFGIGKQKGDELIRSFERSANGLTQSPDPEKPYGVWSSNGKLIRWVDFPELLRLSLGFRTTEGREFSNKFSKVIQGQNKYNEHVNDAMNLLVDGDEKGFERTVNKYDLQIGDISAKMKSYTVPLDQRMFSRFSPAFKAKYFNLIYPEYAPAD